MGDEELKREWLQRRQQAAVEAAVVETAGYVEGINESVEATAAAENGVDSSGAAVIGKRGPKEVSGKAAEKVEERVTEWNAPGVPLVLVLEANGSRQTVEFTYKPLGFEYSQPTACCVLPAKVFPKPPVRVTRVAAKQQAATLGVECGATICSVNGKDIADPIQLQDLLAVALATLPEADASN